MVLLKDPWGLHYAASQGEMDRLQLLLDRYRDRSDGDELVVRVLMDKRDRDSGRTALHFAARAAKVCGNWEEECVYISTGASCGAFAGPGSGCEL